MKIKTNRKVSVNIAKKRSYRRIRSRYKSRIINFNAIITDTERAKYNLGGIKFQRKLYRPVRVPFRQERIVIPKTFCTIRGHKETIKFFTELNELLKDPEPFNLYVDYNNTENIGLDASFYFDHKIAEYKRKWAEKRYRIKIEGLYSKVKEVNNFLLSQGFLKEIGVRIRRTSPRYDIDYKDKYVIYKFAGSNKNTFESGNASLELAYYFNNCFNYNDLEIKETPLLNLVAAFGEIIGNAEEHCGQKIARWYVRGSYNKEDHYCSFAIINFGKTVYESLSDKNSTTKKVISKINAVVKKHRKLSKKLKATITEHSDEPTWNLMALQEGISSKRPNIKTGKRSTKGQGLMDVLKFIDQIRSPSDEIQVALISGHSKILIDYEYPLIDVYVGLNKEKRKQIIFNREKKLYEPQDENKVILLDTPFPGTIVTGRFKINDIYLKELLRDKNGNNN